MALTDDDISKLSKIVKTIVRSEVGNESKDIKSVLGTEIKLSNMRIQNSINELEDRIKNVETTQNDDSKILTSVEKNIKKLRKDLEKTIGFFDKSDIALHNKLNKTRSEIGLAEFNFA